MMLNFAKREVVKVTRHFMHTFWLGRITPQRKLWFVISFSCKFASWLQNHKILRLSQN